MSMLLEIVFFVFPLTFDSSYVEMLFLCVFL